MKVTLTLTDEVLNEARRLAACERTTVESLVEEGLRLVLREHRQGRRFRLESASFRGQGLQPEVADVNWKRVCALIYADRGGN